MWVEEEGWAGDCVADDRVVVTDAEPVLADADDERENAVGDGEVEDVMKVWKLDEEEYAAEVERLKENNPTVEAVSFPVVPVVIVLPNDAWSGVVVSDDVGSEDVTKVAAELGDWSRVGVESRSVLKVERSVETVIVPDVPCVSPAEVERGSLVLTDAVVGRPEHADCSSITFHNNCHNQKKVSISKKLKQNATKEKKTSRCTKIAHGLLYSKPCPTYIACVAHMVRLQATMQVDPALRRFARTILLVLYHCIAAHEIIARDMQC